MIRKTPVPAAFHANGSTAKELALVLNRNEATLMSGMKNALFRR
jgi:hypothetical protein